MKRPEVNALDQLMMDIIIVHRSLWNPCNDDDKNLSIIKSLRDRKTPSIKWFMQTFVHDDPKISTSNLVAISYGLIGMWAFASSMRLSESELSDAIDSVWERKNDALDEAILKIKKNL